ncbi:unnamed protein product [Pleuronectes platessa]|uniref:Uncharacterized protein n=1 Tax=Pleuronectes platessa TaxID=8262 RepID=A0A9N7Z5G6_PLEPL|nr:unnamed protein product [Pleuronectes platessa]
MTATPRGVRGIGAGREEEEEERRRERSAQLGWVAQAVERRCNRSQLLPQRLVKTSALPGCDLYRGRHIVVVRRHKSTHGAVSAERGGTAFQRSGIWTLLVGCFLEESCTKLSISLPI